MTAVDGTPAPDALRELVREVLRDLLPSLATRNGSSSVAAPASPLVPPAPSSAASLDGLVQTALPVSAVPPMSPAVPATPPTSDPPPTRPDGAPGVGGSAGAGGSAEAGGSARVGASAGIGRSAGVGRSAGGGGSAGAGGTAGKARTSGTTGAGRTDGLAGAGGTVRAGGAARAYENASGVTLQPVRLATDEDLREFVLQIIRLADNPKRRRELVAGRFRFTLAAAGSSPAPPGLGPARPGPERGPAQGSSATGLGVGSARPDPGPFPAPGDPAHARGVWSANGRNLVVAAERGRAGASGGDHRIERGAVTERAVQAAASAGVRLVLGPRAVLTPLARDRARALGVPIEKER